MPFGITEFSGSHLGSSGHSWVAVGLSSKLRRPGDERSICQLRSQGSGTSIGGTLVGGVDAEIFRKILPEEDTLQTAC